MEDVIQEFDQKLNNSLIKTFTRMFLGLLLTAAIAYLSYAKGVYLQVSYSLLAILEIAVVLIFSLLFKKLSPMVVTILFYGYAALNGVTMGVIFAVYSITTIGYVFLVSALLFGALALYGYTTKNDLSKFSTIFTVTLIVGLIVSVINLFLNIGLINTILDWVMLFIFCGITAYDLQKIKSAEEYGLMDSEKMHIYFAMELYLDFINIFIRLLSIMGKRRK